MIFLITVLVLEFRVLSNLNLLFISGYAQEELFIGELYFWLHLVSIS